MSYALALIGFLGFFITNIYMIIQAVKKKFRKKLLLPPLICFILFIIGAGERSRGYGIFENAG